MFIAAVVAAALLSAGVLALGVRRWRTPAGQLATVAGGLMLAAVAVYALVVLYLADAAERGAPL